MTKPLRTTLKAVSGEFPCDVSELDLGVTLSGGQSFRWKEIDDKRYRGVFSHSVWTLHQDATTIFYTAHSRTLRSPSDCEETLRNYFRLDTSLRKNLAAWSQSDGHFGEFSSRVSGVRILQQDVVENLFSFICSANNHITRITGMVEKLCSHFGEKIGAVDGDEFFDFPGVEALSADGVAAILVDQGFGYRAKYLNNSARRLVELGGAKWLEDLRRDRGTSYESARESLMTLPGIGRKVADCICLMSLGHLDAIPVDTHIWQVAREVYLPNLKKLSSNSAYDEVSRHFRDIWGPMAGWAQAVVFCTRIREAKKSKVAKENSESKRPRRK